MARISSFGTGQAAHFRARRKQRRETQRFWSHRRFICRTGTLGFRWCYGKNGQCVPGSTRYRRGSGLGQRGSSFALKYLEAQIIHECAYIERDVDCGKAKKWTLLLRYVALGLEQRV